MAAKKDKPKATAQVRRVAARVRATRKKRTGEGTSRQVARARAREIIKDRPKATAKVRKIAGKVRARRLEKTGEGTTRQDARKKARSILAKKVPGTVSKGDSSETRKKGGTRKRKHKV